MSKSSMLNQSFLRMTKVLVRELEQSPERRDEILTKYSNLAECLEVKTMAVGAHGFMFDCIDSLYGKDEEHLKRADRARYALGGAAHCVRLTKEERLAFANVLIKVFKEVFGVDPFLFEL